MKTKVPHNNDKKGLTKNLQPNADYQRPLKGKRVFLDLKGFRGQAPLERNLKLLGATIERCFSKDVHTLVTNRGCVKDYANLRCQPDNSNAGTPSPSPFNLGGYHGSLDSPVGDSPSPAAGNEKSVHMTRGQKMAQQAKLVKKFASLDILENARRWRVKTVHVEVVQKWLLKELEKLPKSVRDESARQAEQEKKKKGKVKPFKLSNYVKVEAMNRQYRPLFQEFSSFPSLVTSGRGNCSRQNNQAHIDMADRGVGKEIEQPEWETAGKQTKSSPLNKKIAKRKRVKGSSHIYTAGELRRLKQEKMHQELKKGYCEVCEVKYENIDQHVKCETHRNFITKPENFLCLDQQIMKGPTTDEFLTEILHIHEKKQDKKHHFSNTKSQSPPSRRQSLSDEVVLLEEVDVSYVQQSALISSPTKLIDTRSPFSKKTMKSCSIQSLRSSPRLKGLKPQYQLNSGSKSCVNKPSCERKKSPKSKVFLFQTSPVGEASVHSPDCEYIPVLIPLPDSPATRTRAKLNVSCSQDNTNSVKPGFIKPACETSITVISRNSAYQDPLDDTSSSEIPIVWSPAMKQKARSRAKLKSPLQTMCQDCPEKSNSKTVEHSDVGDEDDCDDVSTQKKSRKSKKTVKLKRNWSVLTDNSTAKLFGSDSECSFEGFNDGNNAESSLPQNLSFVDVSEVELSETSDVEWILPSEEEKVNEEEVNNKHILPFLTTLGAPLFSEGSSEWDNNLGSFVEDQVHKKKMIDTSRYSRLFSGNAAPDAHSTCGLAQHANANILQNEESSPLLTSPRRRVRPSLRSPSSTTKCPPWKTNADNDIFHPKHSTPVHVEIEEVSHTEVRTSLRPVFNKEMVRHKLHNISVKKQNIPEWSDRSSMVGEEAVEDEIIFNYSSPQRMKCPPSKKRFVTKENEILENSPRNESHSRLKSRRCLQYGENNSHTNDLEVLKNISNENGNSANCDNSKDSYSDQCSEDAQCKDSHLKVSPVKHLSKQHSNERENVSSTDNNKKTVARDHSFSVRPRRSCATDIIYKHSPPLSGIQTRTFAKQQVVLGENSVKYSSLRNSTTHDYNYSCKTSTCVDSNQDIFAQSGEIKDSPCKNRLKRRCSENIIRGINVKISPLKIVNQQSTDIKNVSHCYSEGIEKTDNTGYNNTDNTISARPRRQCTQDIVYNEHVANLVNTTRDRTTKKPQENTVSVRPRPPCTEGNVYNEQIASLGNTSRDKTTTEKENTVSVRPRRQCTEDIVYNEQIAYLVSSRDSATTKQENTVSVRPRRQCTEDIVYNEQIAYLVSSRDSATTKQENTVSVRSRRQCTEDIVYNEQIAYLVSSRDSATTKQENTVSVRPRRQCTEDIVYNEQIAYLVSSRDSATTKQENTVSVRPRRQCTEDIVYDEQISTLSSSHERTSTKHNLALEQININLSSPCSSTSTGQDFCGVTLKHHSTEIHQMSSTANSSFDTVDKAHKRDHSFSVRPRRRCTENSEKLFKKENIESTNEDKIQLERKVTSSPIQTRVRRRCTENIVYSDNHSNLLSGYSPVKQGHNDSVRNSTMEQNIPKLHCSRKPTDKKDGQELYANKSSLKCKSSIKPKDSYSSTDTEDEQCGKSPLKKQQKSLSTQMRSKKSARPRRRCSENVGYKFDNVELSKRTRTRSYCK